MRFVLAFWNLVNSTYPRHCDTKMLMVCIIIHAYVRVYVHTAWASVLLFGYKGNTRASTSGTARLQSRFCFYKAEHNPSPAFIMFTNEPK